MDKIILDIPISTIIKVVVSIVAIYFLWAIRDIILLFFIVLVLVAALSPIVDKWSKKMNRVLAITLLYILILVVIVSASAIILPPAVMQIEQLSNSLPKYFNDYLPLFGFWSDLLKASQEGLTTVAQSLSSITNQVFTATIGVFGGLIAAFTVIVLTFYLLLEEQGAKKFILEYLPLENREKIVNIAQKIGNKMGAWLRGQIMLGAIIGVLVGIGLAIIGVPYAVTLAVWAGFTELIPYIGPILGAIPAILIGFATTPLIGILVVALYIVIQQLEASVLVPKVMQKAVGLSPVIIILAILIGAKLAGLIGVILSIPVAAAVGVIITDWNLIKKVNLK